MARLALAVVLASVLVASGCGGGPSPADARQTVRDFVAATNKRDGDELCGRLLSQDYMEKATGATGDGVEKACKQQLALVNGLRLRLVSLGPARVKGDTATVHAVIAAAGQQSPRVFTLAKEGGRWKLRSGEAGQ